MTCISRMPRHARHIWTCSSPLCGRVFRDEGDLISHRREHVLWERVQRRLQRRANPTNPGQPTTPIAPPILVPVTPQRRRPRRAPSDLPRTPFFDIANQRGSPQWSSSGEETPDQRLPSHLRTRRVHSENGVITYLEIESPPNQPPTTPPALRTTPTPQPRREVNQLRQFIF
ncbi:hypothetical protein BOTBODRAFT_64933 [Botryobasidium botryosum FD-172 SS1]|uniref:C2H2-type domain-containing protein n=1 Tax=Botryobasidium botryosum (strain FD-172 SS1) TaxID=930990 RepID=A0A067MNS2_BOTB1|nr:hypothetical protein BOTBODRAFT_64933 [Botryobasidium botryosum FD-172 SS1]